MAAVARLCIQSPVKTMTIDLASVLIKQKAIDLGFAACGIAKAEPVDLEAVNEQEEWLTKGYAADMDYMHKNKELRYDPRELFPGAKSLIVVALNYYPKQIKQSDITFSYYSYGKDYHFVVKNLLLHLLKYIEEELCPFLPINHALEGRAFSDSAPLMERYWAKKTGIGFQGRNRLIIIPRVGSYCFLGVLAVNIDLSVDKPVKITCGTCHKCEESCPTHAICDGFVDSNRCISYQTIENRSDYIPEDIAISMGSRVYGCDACQQICPWNRFAKATSVTEFEPSEEFMTLDLDKLKSMGSGEFKRLFKCSAIARAGLKGLRRNAHIVKNTIEESKNSD